MGFIRNQEVNLAVRLLKWKYQNAGISPLDETLIRKQAENVVDDAHRIAKERGNNVVTIIKDLVSEIQKK